MARINWRIFAICYAVVLAAGAFFPSAAVTRWSALQLVPGADMLPGGRFVAEADLAWGMQDDFSVHSPVSVQRLHVGFSEWVGLDVGYADGFTMGLKACVLKDNAERWYVPTLSFGLQNIYTSREALYFGRNKYPYNDYPRNEFFVVAAKSSEWAKLRGHVGVMSAATYGDRADLVNPYVGLEKYFGQGLYMTVEGQRRSSEFLLSVFVVYRPFPDRLELSVGLIDAPALAGSRGGSKFRRGAGSMGSELRVGLRANLGSGYNSLDGLGGVEDRIDRYKEQLASFGARIDSLTVETRWNADRIHELSGFPDDRKEDRARVMDELVKLRNLYDQEPFDPELVRNMTDRFRDRYQEFAPHLRVIITDPDADPRIRRLAVSLIGETGDQAASNILISILNRFEEPALKIETMIALGKLKETRCREILAKLRSDPDAGVSFTASEVYNAMFAAEEAEAGKKTMPIIDEENIGDAVPERRLGK